MRGLLLCCVLVLAGCGSEHEQAPPEAATTGESAHVLRVGNPTGAEREFVNTVGEWLLTSGDFVTRDCPDSLEDYAGKPPTERMDELAARAAAACTADGAEAERLKEDAVRRIAGYELHWGGAGRLPTKGGKTRDSRIEPKFSDAATDLVEQKAEVRCWSEDDWRSVAAAGSPYDDDVEGGAEELAGFVSDDRRIHLAPDVCADLVELAYGDVDEPDADVAFAVVALAHEARHSGGELREGRTECWAVQNGERLARLLGAGEGLARDLAELYWGEIYSLQEPPYSSEECRDGGALDLRPESDRWP